MQFVVDWQLAGSRYRSVDLRAAANGRLSEMPHIHRVLLENIIRADGPDVERDRAALLSWLGNRSSTAEIAFLPSRILMHDTTCGPALVDIAERSADHVQGCLPAVALHQPPHRLSQSPQVRRELTGTCGGKHVLWHRIYFT